MARESEKSTRKMGGKSDATVSNGDSTKPTAGAASKSSKAGKPSDVDVAGYQSSQYETLRAILDKRSDDAADPVEIVREFAAVWFPAHAVDIELLVPAGEQAEADMDKRSAVQVRKDLLNILLADLLGDGDSDEMSAAKLKALSDVFNGLDKAVQQESEGLGDRVAGLGQKMKDRFERLKQRFADLDEGPGEAMDLLAPRCLSVFAPRQRPRREHKMARYSSSTPDRDERGRFTSDDDREYSRGGGRRDMPERDESGRFMSEGRGSRGRYDEDDDERYGRRSMGRSRDDEDDDRSSGGRGRGHGGWFGDREGHSEASRRGWDDPRHGESGWYGDPEGHSEASRRGWEGRSSSSRYRDEDERSYRSQSGNGDRERDDNGRFMSERRSRSRYEDEDDDRRSSRGRGHGGWSGDPEGHSEAARRGWEHRR